MDVDRLLSLRRCSAVAIHPDGSWLAVAASRLDAEGTRYVSDLWRVPLDGGAPTRLTQSDTSCTAPAFRSDGALLFLARRARASEPEDERTSQVWCLPAGGGEAAPLTDEPLGVEAFRVAGDTLATLSLVLPGVPEADQARLAAERRKKGPSALRYTAMPVRYWDHWLAPEAPHLVVRRADGTGRRDLTPGADREYRESPWDLSPDGTHVRIARATRAPDAVRSDVLERWDLATGTCTEEAWATGPRQGIGVVRCAPAGGPDVAIVERRDGPGAPRVVLLVHREGVERVWDDHYPHEVVFLDAHTLAVTVDRDGRLAVRVIDLRGQLADRWTEVGSHEAIVARPGDATTLHGLHHRFTQPPEPFRWRLAGPVEVVGRLSGAAEGELVADVQELRVPGAEGDPVHAFVLSTPGRGPAPGLLWATRGFHRRSPPTRTGGTGGGTPWWPSRRATPYASPTRAARRATAGPSSTGSGATPGGTPVTATSWR